MEKIGLETSHDDQKTNEGVFLRGKSATTPFIDIATVDMGHTIQHSGGRERYSEEPSPTRPPFKLS
jgi:hypothetical protein